MKMQYLESLQAFVTTEIRIWDPSQPPIGHGCLNQNILSTPVYLLHGDKRVTKNHGQADRTANKCSTHKKDKYSFCE